MGKLESCANSFFIMPKNEEKIINIAKKLKHKYSSGSDNVPDYVVKLCIQDIAKPLTDIFILEYSPAFFLTKSAEIKPLYESGKL